MNEQQVGSKSWLELKEENNKNYTPLTLDNAYIPSADSWREASAYRGAEKIQTPLMNLNTGDYLGKSKYDPAISSFAQFDNYQDIRANNQSGWAKVGAGLAKGVITTGTTFVSGVAGLTTGLVQGVVNAAEGGSFWEGLWNNETMKSMNYISKKAEELLPNYYTRFEQEHPLALDNIFSWNFLGDKFIKNLGFTIGAFYSGQALSTVTSSLGKLAGGAFKLGKTVTKGLRGATLLASDLEKAANVGNAYSALIGATLSAVNEGSIEALNSSEDFFKLGKAQLTDDLNNKLTRAEAFKNLDPEGYNEYTNRIQEEYKVKVDKLKEESAKVGNLTLALNIPILTASNMFQFGKLYSRGFKTASKGVGYDRAARQFFNDTRREAEKSTLKRRVLKGIANGLSEGKEEVLQQLASDYAGTLYSPSNKEFYNLGLYSAEIDPLFNYTTTEWTKAAASTIANTLGQESTWEQFIIGTMTGFLGMPVFGRANTSEAWLGKNKSVGLAGGLLGEIFNKPVIDETIDSKVEALNQRMQDPNFKAYYKSLIRNNKFEAIKNAAALAGDKKTFKDAEAAQLISDSVLFYETGQLDIFEEMLKNINLSDENIDDIITITTSQQKPVLSNDVYNNYEDSNVYYGPFVDSYGNPLSKKEIKKKIESKINSLLQIADGLRAYSDYVDSKFGSDLQREQKNELLYTFLRRDNLIQRSSELLNSIKEKVAKSIDNGKWSKYLSKDEREVLKRFSTLSDDTTLEEADIDVKVFNSALNKFGKNLDKVYNTSKPESLEKALEFFQTVQDINSIEEDLEAIQSDLDAWEKDINKLKEKQQKETERAVQNTRDNIQNNRTATITDKINNATSEAELHNSLKDENTSDLFDLLEKSSNPVAKDYLATLRAIDYIKNKVGKDLSNQEYSILSDLFSNFLSVDGKYDNLNSDNPNLFNFSILPDNIKNKEELLNKFKKLIAENKPSKESLESAYSRPYRVSDDDFQEEDAPLVVSEDTNLPEEGAPQVPAIIDNIPEDVVAQEIPKDEIQESRTDTGLQDAYNENIEGEREDKETNPITQKEKYAKTATPKYTVESLRGNSYKATEWTMQENDGTIYPTRAYLERNGAFSFIDSGRLYEHSKKDRTLYFGIDPSLNEHDILIFAKLEDGTYQVIGNNFLSKSRTESIDGLSQLNKDVYEEYTEWKKNGGNGKFISQTRTAELHNIRRGRIKVSDAIRTVKEAIQASKINTKPILVIVKNQSITPAVDTKRILKFSNKDNGQVKLIVQNPAGTESVITATPKKVEAGDIQNSNDRISESMGNAFKSLLDVFNANLDHNSDEYKNGIKKAKSALFKHLSARELGITSDNKKIYFSIIDRSKLVTDKNGNKIHPSTIIKAFELSELTTTNEEGKTNAYYILEDALMKVNARFRVNQESVVNEDSRLGITAEDWLNSDKLTTHAMSLDLETSWFDYEIPQKKQAQTQNSEQGKLSQEEKEKQAKLEEKRKRLRNRLGMESNIEHTNSITGQNKTREQIKEEAVKKLSAILPISGNDAIRVVETLMLDGKSCDALIDLDSKLIYLIENAEEGAEYHEAFHYVSQLLLNPRQRETIYNEAKEIFGDLSEDILEERLAEDFRKYVNMNTIPNEYKGLSKIKRWFINLKDKLKFYVQHRNTGILKSLYKDIMNGKYTNSEILNNEASGKLSKVVSSKSEIYTFNLNNEEDAKNYRETLELYNRFSSLYKNGIKAFKKEYQAEEYIKELNKRYPYAEFVINWSEKPIYNDYPFSITMLKPKAFEGTSNGQIIKEKDRLELEELNNKLLKHRQYLINKALDIGGFTTDSLAILSNEEIENIIKCSGVS